MAEGKRKRRTGIYWAAGIWLAGVVGLLSACSGMTAPAEDSVREESISLVTTAEESSVKAVENNFEESVVETVTETQMTESAEAPAGTYGSVQPVGHQIIYSDGEIYGWTRYEYDENGRKEMIIFITPGGNEYWSPVFYDGNGHVIPETVGTYSLTDENGLHLEVGTEDNRGRRTPMAQYEYDQAGNLTDYWYMYVSGKYLRYIVYSYDSKDHLIKEELYYASKNRLESYVEYIYNGQGQLIRKNEVEDTALGTGVYTLYQYNEEGYLTREEVIWGGQVHDYVDYYYNEDGVLIREYHFLEDKMMGGPYTVEYLFEVIDDSAG